MHWCVCPFFWAQKQDDDRRCNVRVNIISHHGFKFPVLWNDTAICMHHDVMANNVDIEGEEEHYQPAAKPAAKKSKSGGGARSISGA